MDSLGVQSFQQLSENAPISKNAAGNALVDCVAEALIAELEPDKRSDWVWLLFEDPTANAFALPGRRIGVNTGMLNVAANADQLAAVVGHEIGHVLAQHGNERMSQELAKGIAMEAAASRIDANTAQGRLTMAALGMGAQYGVLLPYSRAHESEADAMGLTLMARAGFDPEQAVKLWQNMAAMGGQAPPEFLSTHPSNQTRIADLTAGLTEARPLYEQARAAGKRPSCTR